MSAGSDGALTEAVLRIEACPADPWRASNRSQECDTLSEEYARFLIEEIPR